MEAVRSTGVEESSCVPKTWGDLIIVATWFSSDPMTFKLFLESFSLQVIVPRTLDVNVYAPPKLSAEVPALRENTNYLDVLVFSCKLIKLSLRRSGCRLNWCNFRSWPRCLQPAQDHLQLLLKVRNADPCAIFASCWNPTTVVRVCERERGRERESPQFSLRLVDWHKAQN